MKMLLSDTFRLEIHKETLENVIMMKASPTAILLYISYIVIPSSNWFITEITCYITQLVINKAICASDYDSVLVCYMLM
jgi:hypothetical protein